MTFTYTPYKQQRSEASGPRREIDFDALNEHMVTQFGPKERRMVGIISGIYDLGIQERDPYEVEWNEKDDHGEIQLAEPAVAARLTGRRPELGEKVAARLARADVRTGEVEFRA